jgi:formate hydrogenlyase transcriptional activator
MFYMQSASLLTTRDNFTARQKERLFSLAAAIASVKDREGLEAVINGLLKKICHFDDMMIEASVNLLSATILNILANEEIIKHEREKSALLDLCNSLATIRDQNHLLKVIQEKIRRLVPFNDILITLYDPASDAHEIFLHAPGPGRGAQSDFQSLGRTSSPFGNRVVSDTIYSVGPVVFDIGELATGINVPSYISYFKKTRIREFVGIALRNGEDIMGALFLSSEHKNIYQEKDFNLIRSVANQVSFAVANILTNKRIEEQLEEITKYKQQLEVENLYLQQEIQTTHNNSEIIGASPAMRKVFQLVSQVAGAKSSVLILGETGTGKELIARALHNTSLRKDKLMVKVNCATLPANLIESELFGHERGSFTGATDRRIGKFELAHNSTLFLDEVGELPIDLQVKLLRALQEKEIERIGGKSVIKTDVRIIAATNRNLQREIQQGNFRSDLYFRLNVFPIIIPPLRERREDIPILAAHFLIKHAKIGAKRGMNFSSRVLKELTAYHWPGNVRELEHLIERSILLTNGPTINQIHLPVADSDDMRHLHPDTYIKTIDEVEREHIISVLKKCNGKVSGIGGAAEKLKIPATTLYSKIRRLKIKKGFPEE